MSCPCPSGYTPTIDSDACIFTITAATSGGSFFYSGVSSDPLSLYGELGVIFYEDVTNLVFPISFSGTSGSTTTENGTPLNSTQFMVDASGRILNIQAGGPGTGINNDGVYGPASITNTLWGQGTGGSGRLNNAGVWATTGGTALPYNEWLGYSYCLDLVSGGTYFIGVAGDDRTRITINGTKIYDTSYNWFTGFTNAYWPYSVGFINFNVFPYTFSSGLNIIEIENLNEGGPAAFVAEIYSGSVSTLSGYTSYSQLSADTLFSTFNFIGQDIPLSSSAATTNTGYTCPSGYSLFTCSGSPYCILIDKTEIVNYCIENTGLGYDDNFKYGGIHNSEPYWVGVSTGYFIYFTTSGYWCMSTILDGPCLLEGPYPCNSSCPDLCDDYVFSGACPTPTPTPTVNCSVLDFTAIFDCEVTPTPSITPTNTVTPTMTPTPSPSDPCGGRAVDVTISGYTPTPTPTISVTPTMTPEVTRPCAISGTVTFSPVVGLLECPSSKKFVDCSNGSLYYAVNPIILPSGGTLNQNDIFKADIDGVSKCVVFLGIELDVIGVNQIDLVDGPLGSITGLSSCDSVCTPDVSPSPTVTPTPTITPTISMTPTPSVAVGYYVYQRCTVPSQFIIQTLPGPTFIPNQVFSTTGSTIVGECWKFVSYSSTYPTLPLGSSSTFLLGNSFPTLGNVLYSSCDDCSFVTGDSGVE
jgi:hypothetical protein